MNSNAGGFSSTSPGSGGTATATGTPAPTAAAAKTASTTAIEKVKKEEPKKGTITEITVTDKEGRSAKGGAVLQIVAAATLKVSISKTFNDPADAETDAEKDALKDTRKFGLGGSIKRGGEDTAKVDIKTSTEKRKQIAWRKATGKPADGDWKSGASQSFPVPFAGADDIFPSLINPDKYYAHGRGEDDATLMVCVESYPSAQLEISVDTKFFEDKAKALTKKLEAKFTKKIGPVELKPKLTPPKGALKFTAGWQEEKKEPKVFLQLEISASLAPIFEIGLGAKVSIATIAATAGLVSLGFPPPIANELAKLGAEYLADLWVEFTATVGLSLVGSVTAKYYPTDGWKGEAKITPKASGKIKVAIGARLGGDKWVSVSVTGSGETGISVEGALEAKSAGITFNPAVKWPGIKITVEWQLKAGWFAVGGDKSWQPLDASTIWKPEKPYVLLPLPKD